MIRDLKSIYNTIVIYFIYMIHNKIFFIEFDDGSD